MDDLIRDFVIETLENLDLVDADLVRFEQEPDNQQLLSQIFRLVHTVKGTCGFLALPRLERVAHAAEGLICRFQEGYGASRDEVSLVLSAIDRIKFIVLSIGETGREPAGDDSGLIDDLTAHAANSGLDPRRSARQEQGTLVYQVLTRPLRSGEVTLDELERVFRETPGPNEAGFDPTSPAGGQTVAEPVHVPVVRAKSVRVAVERLDHLMNMVSELVLVRNQLTEVARLDDSSGYKLPLQRLSHITGELQDGVMRTRMQTIAAAWSNMPRIARDLSAELGKHIVIETRGADTEIDRQLLEVIKDCIVHIVRNAADHGIETPEERIASDKSPHGTIRLIAGQEGSHIFVEVADDGRGINLERVRERAYLLGLIDEDARLRMADNDAARLIFAPGFSTAAQVTNLSGRGVGLDAVRASIEQIGGAVDVVNRPGQGVSILLKMPLTLAIAAVLIVESQGQKFALPQLVIGELVRAQPGTDVRIEMINGIPTLWTRSGLLPVIDLGAVLDPSREASIESGFVVICRFGHQRFGLAVDVIHQTEEIVVKPISAKLRQIPYFSGVTILGDGAVILILEPAGFARLSDEFGARLDSVEPSGDTPQSDVEMTSLLVFRAGKGNLRVAPLALVARLEDVDASEISEAGGHPVVRYQGQLMPLLLAAPDVVLQTSGRQPLLIFSHADKTIGVAVDEIVDVIEAVFDIDLRHAEEGFIGSAIVQDQAMDVVDVAGYFRHFDQTGGVDHSPRQRAPGVLLVERSAFFQAMLAPLLKGSGYAVEIATTSAQARDMAHEGNFDIVIIDMDGIAGDALDLARDLAADPLAGEPAIIGIATRIAPALNRRAQDAGITAVVGKFDRHALLRTIGETLYPAGVAA